MSPEQREALVRVAYMALAIVLVMPLSMTLRTLLFRYTLGRISLDIQRSLARKLLSHPRPGVQCSWQSQFGNVVASRRFHDFTPYDTTNNQATGRLVQSLTRGRITAPD